MTIEKWLSDVYYDAEASTYIWNKTENGELEMIASIRGWGTLQYHFETDEEAFDFQDEVGEFIAQAIREKVERDFKKK
jgi:hypothetical protein